MGHVETGDLARAGSAAEAREVLERLTLAKVKEILDEAIRSRADARGRADEPGEVEE
jgi:hypothetical protein